MILLYKYLHRFLGTSGGVMVSKQTFMSEFKSHWVPHSYHLVPYLSKKLRKLQLTLIFFIINSTKL